MQEQNSPLTQIESIFAEIAEDPQQQATQSQQSHQDVFGEIEDTERFNQLLRGQYSSATVAKNVLDSVALSAGIKCFCAFSIRCGFPVWAAAGIPVMLVLPLLADALAHIPVTVSVGENSIDNKNSDAIIFVTRLAQGVSVASTGYESFQETLAAKKNTQESVKALHTEIDAAEGKKPDSMNFTPILGIICLVVFLLSLLKSKV